MDVARPAVQRLLAGTPLGERTDRQAVTAMLALQRTAGNSAVQRLIGGKSSDGQADGMAIRPPDEATSQDEVETEQTGGKTAQRNGSSATTAPPVAPPVTAKLTKSEVYPAKSSPRGGYDWMIQWKLNNPSPAGGWVVQKVNVTGEIKDRPGGIRRFFGMKGSKVATGWERYVPYWEAWRINAGKAITTYAEGGDANDDQFANGSYPDGTKGAIIEAGSAQFYEGLTLPTSFKANGVKPAGILEATGSDPGTLAGGTGAIAHVLSATWDSQAGDGTTAVTTN